MLLLDTQPDVFHHSALSTESLGRKDVARLSEQDTPLKQKGAFDLVAFASSAGGLGALSEDPAAPAMPRDDGLAGSSDQV